MDTPRETLSLAPIVRTEIYLIEGRLVRLALRVRHDDELTAIFRDLSDSVKRLKKHFAL